MKLGVFTLAIMNVTAVVSLRGLPAEAVYGMSSAFYYLFAAIVFLIPTSLVAAELAAMFQDKQGGVFRWVGEAYGKKLGFLAIWVQWIESTIWYPTVLTFGAVSIAFIGMNDVHDMSLANNKYYSLVVVLIIYWLATFISMKGMSWVGLSLIHIYRLHAIFILHSVHIIVGTDASTNQSPGDNGFRRMCRKSPSRLLAFHHSFSRLRKQHDTFGTRGSLVLHLVHEERQRVYIFVRSRLYHIQMQVRTERVSGVSAQSYYLTGLHGIFVGFGSNFHLPTFFLVLQVLSLIHI